MPSWSYPLALLLASALVFGFERLWPARPQQRWLRPRLGSDVLHLVFNGHFLGAALYGLASHYVAPRWDTMLHANGWDGFLGAGSAASWSLWVQIPVALLAIDLMQWGVHWLLHRVPFLWEWHKTHHSVGDGEMDWIVSFRFQWTEVVVYRALLYLPLAWLGFSTTAIFVHAVFGTLIGHLNHANLRWDYGPLRYVLNNPRMHIWHHDRARGGRDTVNYGIIFSTWDWLFGTALLPDGPPRHLGFEGDETFPRSFGAQELWPLSAMRGQTARRLLAVAGTVAMFGAWWWSTRVG